MPFASCNYPHLWPAQGRLEVRLRALLEPDKITRGRGTSNGSAQNDTPLRKAGKVLIRQGKMWVIASVRVGGHQPGGQEPGAQAEVAAVQHRPGGDRDLPLAGRALERQPLAAQF